MLPVLGTKFDHRKMFVVIDLCTSFTWVGRGDRSPALGREGAFPKRNCRLFRWLLCSRKRRACTPARPLEEVSLSFLAASQSKMTSFELRTWYLSRPTALFDDVEVFASAKDLIGEWEKKGGNSIASEGVAFLPVVVAVCSRWELVHGDGLVLVILHHKF